MGYNQLPNYVLDNPAEPGLAWVIEPRYDDGLGHQKIEGYCSPWAPVITMTQCAAHS